MRRPLLPLCSLLLALAACSDAPAPLDLSSRLAAGQARAGLVAKDADLIGGPTASGEKGDFKLYNARVAVIVEAAGPSHGYGSYGGFVIDADLVRAPGEPGRSAYGEALALYNRRTPRAVSGEVVNDGRDGKAALVRMHCVDDAFPLIESILGQSRGAMGLEIDIDYVLEPDAPYLKVISHIRNTSEETAHVTDHFVGYVMGDGLRQFLPGHGFDVPQVPRPSPYFAAANDFVSYSFLSIDGQFAPTITFQGFLLGTLPLFHLPPGADATSEMDLVIGDGNLAPHVQLHEQLLAAAGRDPSELAKLAGIVVDSKGQPVAAARVNVLRKSSDDYVIQAIAGADGRFEAWTPPGAYRLAASKDGHAYVPTFLEGTAGSDGELRLTIGGAGTLELKATEAGAPVPVKLMLVRKDAPPAAPRSFGGAERPHGYERLEFLPAAAERLLVPPGHYTVHASRGFEYELEEVEVEVRDGEVTPVALAMRHVVETTGWVSGDYHVHAQFSADSDDLVEHKVLASAAEGLEIPVFTEHEYIADFAPMIARLGLGKYVRSIVGEEVSTTQLGHFNAFPLQRDPLASNFGALSWFGVKGDDLMKQLRANPAGPLVQVNHPRSGSFGSPFIKGYFSATGFDPATFQPRGAYDWSIDYDAIEIANGGGPDFADWFSFLDHGLRMLATGNSDSHIARTEAVGYPRNYVQTDVDDPAAIEVAPFMTALRAGRLTVSGGFFVELGAGEARLGALLPASSISAGKVSVQVRVQAPSWVPGGTLELLVDGAVVASIEVPKTAENAAIRVARTIEVTVPDRDSWILARVTGAGPLTVGWPGKPAFGFTNPLFVDANGNGGFDARLPRP